MLKRLPLLAALLPLRSATAQTEFLRLFFAVNHLNLSAQAAQLLIKALIATLNIDDVVYPP